jgi:glycerophosphoryl diester phosphodiesterase
MKVAIPQLKYPSDYNGTLEVMNEFLAIPQRCEDGTDLLVLPEYSNCPGMPLSDSEAILKHCRKHTGNFMASLKDSAIENNLNICVNMLFERDCGFTNTTLVIGRAGQITAEYDKTHLAYTEIDNLGLIPGSKPVFIEIDGAVVTFAVCFELYFPEFFEALAPGKPDIILAPSYQRSEKSEILIKQAMGRSLDSGTYLIRSSYSMGPDSIYGGSSYAVSPCGDVLLDAGQDIGLYSIEFDPKDKRMRPLAHGLGEMPSREIIEKFRIPSLYRKNAGSLKTIEFPSVCAHRGLSALVPENTLPAFAAAQALGADEIEFDIRLTADNKIIVCHDVTVDRVSDGSGEVSSLSFNDIRALNAGEYMGWKDVRFPTPEEVFNLFGGRTIMNIHVYCTGENGHAVKELQKLIHKYGIGNSVYFAAQEKEMKWCLEIAPEISRCMLECFDENRDIVDIALEYNCKRVQHFYSVYSPKIVRKSSESGLINNLFFEDQPSKIAERLRDGIDTILTNYADRIIPVVKNP